MAVVGSVAGAAGFTSALAACEPEGPRFTPEVANRFLRNPSSVLRPDVYDTYGLTVFVTQFAAARSRELEVLKSLIPDADVRQRAAIGDGLFRAVTFCRVVDSTIATRIEDWARTLANRDVVLGYERAELLANSYTNDAALPKREPEKGGDGKMKLMTPPSTGGVGSLKIPDPFGSPDDWK